MSTVSVVIPCYNYSHFLPDCVNSVLTNQPGVDVRVLVIDDASTDDSAHVAKQIAANETRVDVITHSVNAGHLATYNEGLLEWADGDYTVLLSADDQLTPGALSRACALLDAHPTVGFSYGHPLSFTHPGPPPKSRTQSRGWSVWPGHWWLERRFRAANGCITSPEVVMRTALLQQVGGFDARLPHTGDIELWMRLAAYSDVGYVRGADQAYYRTHQDNMSKSHDLFGDLVQRRLAYEVTLERCADALSELRQELSDAVHRKLAWQALWYAARAYDRGRTDQVPVDELVAFASDCWPDVNSLSSFWGLQLRQRLGPTVMPYMQPLILTAVAKKAQEWWWWRSWRRRGI
jgi:glycosyltransferase involved in cell wall biosynthesis